MADKEKDPAAAEKAKAKALAAKKAGLEAKAAKTSGPTMQTSDGREVKHETPRLKKSYHEVVVPALMEKYGLKNPFQVPHLEKVVVNIGVSDARDNIQNLDVAREELAMITGQWPQVRKAAKSISNFKLREGMPIGVRVTLRGDRMYEFVDRLISTAIPRIRDFRGLEPKGFDGHGNYNLGLKEQLIFPEVNVEKSPKQRGMNITVVTSAANDEIGMDLLRHFGMPFKAAAEAVVAGRN
ncbi:MAG: 50S ribosomal protein L5 [Elusimicrobia bacterium]|nr:50S ribosomal protein L5 [Elusimicrobiota bacterium]